MNDLCADIGYKSILHAGEQLCGDHVDIASDEYMKGVMDTNWNPRTRELTVRYDANKTSARNIKHFVA